MGPVWRGGLNTLYIPSSIDSIVVSFEPYVGLVSDDVITYIVEVGEL